MTWLRAATRPFRRTAHYVEGFWLPNRPQSSARIMALGFAAAAIYDAIRHPDQSATIIGLATTAVGVYATRTDSGGRPFWKGPPDPHSTAEKVVSSVVAQVEKHVDASGV